MATFFSLSPHSLSSLSLLLLLALTTGDLFPRADAAAAIDSICSQTKQPPRCETLLKATDTRSPTAPLPVLGEIAVTAATGAAGEVRIEVHTLSLRADPRMKGLYTNCEDLYLSALDQLYMARDYLQNRSYGKLVAAAGVVGRDVGGCASAVTSDGGLKQKIQDAIILADAVAVIARNLA